jgi:hypothetical protein
MGRLARFLRLEGARPIDGRAADTHAHASARFRAIEPRRDPAAPADDPFAPPPEPELRLEVAPDQAPEADLAKEQRRARAEAELAELERTRLAQQTRDEPPAPAWLQRPGFHVLARLTTVDRVVILGTASLVIGILAQLAGPVAWGLLPIVAAVVVGSHFLHRA